MPQNSILAGFIKIKASVTEAISTKDVLFFSQAAYLKPNYKEKYLLFDAIDYNLSGTKFEISQNLLLDK